MTKRIALGLVFANLLALPALAEDCGRWVECPEDPKLSIEETRSYIYGRNGDVEPWLADDEAEKFAPSAAKPAATPYLGASAAAVTVAKINDIAKENEESFSAEAGNSSPGDQQVFAEDTITDFSDLSPEELAAMRAYLAEVDQARSVETDFGQATDSELENVKILVSE